MQQFYFNQYLSFGNAQQDISSSIHDFATTFSPIPPDDTSFLKELLDGLSLIYGQLAAFGWNKIAKALFTDANNHGWTKDAVNSIVGGMTTLGKDLLPA